jgi:hypothetical protein
MSSGEMKVMPVIQQKKNKKAEEEARQNNLMCPMNYDSLILEPITHKNPKGAAKEAIEKGLFKDDMGDPNYNYPLKNAIQYFNKTYCKEHLEMWISTHGRGESYIGTDGIMRYSRGANPENRNLELDMNDMIPDVKKREAIEEFTKKYPEEETYLTKDFKSSMEEINRCPTLLEMSRQLGKQLTPSKKCQRKWKEFMDRTAGAVGAGGAAAAACYGCATATGVATTAPAVTGLCTVCGAGCCGCFGGTTGAKHCPEGSAILCAECCKECGVCCRDTGDRYWRGGKRKTRRRKKRRRKTHRKKTRHSKKSKKHKKKKRKKTRKKKNE